MGWIAAVQEQVSHPGTSLAIHVGAWDDPLVSPLPFLDHLCGGDHACTAHRNAVACGSSELDRLTCDSVDRPSRQRHRGKVKAYLLVASLGALVCGTSQNASAEAIVQIHCGTGRRVEGKWETDRHTHTCTLPRVQFAGSGVKGSWPICYDYLADQSECPKIDVTGLVSAIQEMNCAHTLTPPSCSSSLILYTPASLVSPSSPPWM